jgi:heat shock protein 4
LYLQVVADAKVTFDQIDVIEVVGSATRSPLITNAIKEFFGKEPQRTLNAEESVCKGCALMGAMLSPNFKVRDFAVVDSTPYAIALSWSASPGAEKMDVEGGEAPATGKGNVVFTEHNVLPSVKMLTFMRAATFDITAAYADESKLAPGASSSICNSVITVPPSASGEPTKIKVKVRLDINGVLSVDSAQAVEEVEEEEPKVEPSPAAGGDAPMDDAPPPGGAPPAGDASGAEPAGQPPAEEAKEAKAPEPVQKKKKLKKHDLVVANKATFQLPASVMETFKNEEYEMFTQDRQIRERQERMNDLESYIYSMRDRVAEGGNLSDYIEQADKDAFLKLLQETEDWLYTEEVETANKSLFISKLDDLKKFGEPPAERFREEEQRPDAYRELEKVLTEYSTLAATTDHAYEHIDAEARAKVMDCVNEVSTWMKTMKSTQEAKSKTEPAACLCKDIYSKKDHVAYTCRPIMNKPKPKPPPKEEPKKDAAQPETPPSDSAPGAGPAPADGDAPMKEETGGAPGGGDGMDVGLD